MNAVIAAGVVIAYAILLHSKHSMQYEKEWLDLSV